MPLRARARVLRTPDGSPYPRPHNRVMMNIVRGDVTWISTDVW